MDGRKKETDDNPSDKGTPTYHHVTVEEAQQNEAYWQVVQNMFREQAARVIQRKWREINGKHYDNNKYAETLKNNANLLRFFREPLDNKYLEHAQSIAQGHWLKLDFHETEFERNIYKALRFGLINCDQLGLALLLHHAQIEFGGKIQQHNFNEAGPYSPVSINYSTSESIANFKERLSKLPLTDQCYFSVNFSRLREALFLYDILVAPGAFQQKEHGFIFAQFISRLKMPKDETASYTQTISALTVNGSKEEKDAKLKLAGLIKKVYREYRDLMEYEFTDSGTLTESPMIMSSLNNHSQHLLSALYMAGPQMPMVKLSHDFREDDLNSPLLCMIIPTIPALISLQEAMHGEEQTTDIYFTAGQISTRLIRYLDEMPHLFGQKRQSRPVELVHPDLVPHHNPHEWGKVYSFILSWHDIFHSWHNGMTVNKSFIRYLRELFTTETNYDMSKSIWFLTDMDFPIYFYVRYYSAIYKDVKIPNMFFTTIAISTILHGCGTDFWGKDISKHDINLLIIVDMILNQKKWATEFLPGLPPEEAFKMDRHDHWQGTSITTDIHILIRESFYNKNLTPFHDTFSTMKKLIENEQSVGVTHSATYYILVYRLCGHPNGLELCQKLDASGLDKFIRWSRNDGLKLLPTNEIIAQLDESTLYDLLNEKLIARHRL